MVLVVSGPVHTIRCESVSKANGTLFFGPPNALALVEVSVSSLTECPDLQKFSATPDFSIFLFDIRTNHKEVLNYFGSYNDLENSCTQITHESKS